MPGFFHQPPRSFERGGTFLRGDYRRRHRSPIANSCVFAAGTHSRLPGRTYCDFDSVTPRHPPLYQTPMFHLRRISGVKGGQFGAGRAYLEGWWTAILLLDRQGRRGAKVAKKSGVFFLFLGALCVLGVLGGQKGRVDTLIDHEQDAKPGRLRSSTRPTAR